VLVRTKGRYAGGGESGEPWLLIKHRDDWSGPIDIAEFAPLSVKSEGDFADILSQDDPDVWRSNRPAKGGETGAMFERIVKRALELRASPSASTPARASQPKTTAKTRATKATKTSAPRKRKKT
jgi:hypothetical protein